MEIFFAVSRHFANDSQRWKAAKFLASNWEFAYKALPVDFRYKLSRDGLEALQRRARCLKTRFSLYAYEWIFRDRETPATNRQIIPTEVPVKTIVCKVSIILWIQDFNWIKRKIIWQF